MIASFDLFAQHVAYVRLVPNAQQLLLAHLLENRGVCPSQLYFLGMIVRQT